jgi:hypothetical protein
MIIGVSMPASRLILVVGACAIAGAISYFGVCSALASHYADLGTLEGYERATRLEPKNARYWDLLGRLREFDTEHTDLRGAFQAYQTSLSLNPRSADTWLDLASLLEGSDPGAARAAFLKAQRAYPASPDVSWRYGNFLLRQGETNPAFAEIRGAVEADPKRAVDAFLLFRRLEPNLDIVFERDLPPVSSVYLDVMRRLIEERRADLALKVWSRLVAVHPKLQPSEIIYFVDGLLNIGQTIEARRVWDRAITFMNIPKTDDPEGSVVWDGGFETDVTGGGLVWRVDASPGSFISYDKKVKHSGARALRISFDGTKNVHFQGVCERVAVEPETSYEFSAWLKTDRLTSDRGVYFRLTTLDNKENQVNQTADSTGTTPWTRISLTWEAPKQSHLLEICVIRDSSGNFDEYKIAGTAWVDDISLVPLNPRTESLRKTSP